MPAQKDLDKNLIFLYHCMKTIPEAKPFNFKDVAQVYGIETSAARMRWVRLRAALEHAMENPGEGDEGADEGLKNPNSGLRDGAAKGTKRKRGGMKASKEAEVAAEVNEVVYDDEGGIGGKKVKVEMV